MSMQYGSDRNINVDVVSLPALPAGSAAIGSVSISAIGGAFTALPAATTNGALVTPGANGIRFWLPAGSSVSFTKAASQPGAAPTLVSTLTGNANGPYVDVNVVAATAGVYLTAMSGGAFYEPI